MPTTPRSRKPTGLRALLSQVSEEEATVEAVRQIVMDALGSDRATNCTCPECGHEFREKQPDVKKQLDAAIALLEQIEGKAQNAVTEPTKIIITRPPLIV